MQAAILHLPEMFQNTTHTRSFSITSEYRRSCMRMLVTMSDCTPTCLCLQEGEEEFGPSPSANF